MNTSFLKSIIVLFTIQLICHQSFSQVLVPAKYWDNKTKYEQADLLKKFLEYKPNDSFKTHIANEQNYLFNTFINYKLIDSSINVAKKKNGGRNQDNTKAKNIYKIYIDSVNKLMKDLKKYNQYYTFNAIHQRFKTEKDSINNPVNNEKNLAERFKLYDSLLAEPLFNSFEKTNRDVDEGGIIMSKARAYKQLRKALVIFPIPNSYAAQLFYDNPENLESYKPQNKAYFLENNFLTFNNETNKIALYTELVSDFIGPVRVGIGTVLLSPEKKDSSQTKEELTKEKTVQRIASAGGTFVLNTSFPLLRFNTRDKFFSGMINFSPHFNIDAPQSDSTSRFSHSTSIGIDFQFTITGIKDLAKFYFESRISHIAGNKTFYNSLQLEGEDRKGFAFNNITVGLRLKNLFTISYSTYFGTSFIKKDFPGILSLKIEPK